MNIHENLIDQLFKRSEITELITLLEKIANNMDNNSAIYIAGVAGFFAVLGTLLGQYFANKTSKDVLKSQLNIESMKLKVNFVNAERLRILNEMKDLFADFQSDMDKQKDIIRRPFTVESQASIQSELDELSYKINYNFQKFFILLNLSNSIEKKLFENISSMVDFLKNCFDIKYTQKEGEELKIDHQKYTKLKLNSFTLFSEIREGRLNQLENIKVIESID